MGPELFFLGIIGFGLLIALISAITTSMDIAEFEAQVEARKVDTAGNLPGEALEQLPSQPTLATKLVSANPASEEPFAPLEVPSQIQSEHPLHVLQADVTPDFMMDEVVGLDATTSDPVELDAPFDQLDLPLACELIDPAYS